MNQRDLAEVKRRLNPDKRNPTAILGGYVDNVGKPITSFALNVSTLYEQENEKYMALFKRVLSGQIGQNLLPIGISSEEPEQAEVYQQLLRLRDSALQDEEAVSYVFERLIEGIRAEHPDMQSVEDAQNADNWLILMMHDILDVKFRGTDGEIDYDNSDRAFSYVLCAICPVKRAKPALRYDPEDSVFHDRAQEWLANAPVMGFLFPLFEDGAADVNTILFYSKDSNDSHQAFLEASFHLQALMPAAEQTDTFQTLLAQSLGKECSLEVVQEMHETVSTMIEEQKKDKEAEPLSLSKKDVARVLTESGVSEEKVEAFQEGFDQVFGAGAVLPAVNIVTPNQFKIDLPSVSVKVDPEYADLLETRVIDGRSYLLIPIEGDIAVNGQPVFPNN
ncbi:MAG: DUF4317 domain-containing protein [Clostridia bacterium]|nr:DUF4317 domain-containing protein [Clostridia bacterium]